ncbi:MULTISPECIES: hypothetical protein [unclassified Bacillus (in: firmicutes)]|uniref:Group-specific protein n=1 Tax=Bacillus bruguierae TaxID=3127667 RepID=A0ABU8FJJ3_9BACI|nr:MULTISPECIES: hypothetical protein [unclassified Bacillus (in: firmicutes)]SFI70318.1 hypothetical protein SAMN04488574_10444 [Bacillus sp. 71mf]SFS89517.1 hypothetical protein SAMN04488145_104322 [Bacillus sp. 103mf]
MKFEDNRLSGIQLGALLVTEDHRYLVIKKNDHYSLLNVETMECSILEVALEHIEEVMAEDLQETVKQIIPAEHLKLVAKNIV